MTMLGVVTAFGLWLLGVPLPVALGFLAGIMTFVPYIGSIASAIPSVIIAASINLTLAVYVIAFCRDRDHLTINSIAAGCATAG
jgi:predicted PurR-regulated permease PerM